VKDSIEDLIDAAYRQTDDFPPVWLFSREQLTMLIALVRCRQILESDPQEKTIN
jgi:hypothetical protein